MLEKIIRWIIAFVLALLGIEYNPRPDEGPKDDAAIVRTFNASSAFSLSPEGAHADHNRHGFPVDQKFVSPNLPFTERV